MSLTKYDIEIARLRAEIARIVRTVTQIGPPGGSGEASGGNGVSGFSVDANGDLILTYAGAPSDVSIDGNGNLILEV